MLELISITPHQSKTPWKLGLPYETLRPNRKGQSEPASVTKTSRLSKRPRKARHQQRIFNKSAEAVVGTDGLIASEMPMSQSDLVAGHERMQSGSFRKRIKGLFSMASKLRDIQGIRKPERPVSWTAHESSLSLLLTSQYVDKGVQTSLEDLNPSHFMRKHDRPKVIAKTRHLSRSGVRLGRGNLQPTLYLPRTPGSVTLSDNTSVTTSSTRSSRDSHRLSNESSKASDISLPTSLANFRRRNSDTEHIAEPQMANGMKPFTKINLLQRNGIRPLISRRAISDSTLADVPKQTVRYHKAVIDLIGEEHSAPRFSKQDSPNDSPSHIEHPIAFIQKDIRAAHPSPKLRPRPAASQAMSHLLSPLRQEFRLSTEIADEGSTPANFQNTIFRRPMEEFDSNAKAFMDSNDTPDHLKGSPLCPLSPKHRGGPRPFCHLHGRLSLQSEDSPGPSSEWSLDSSAGEDDCFFTQGAVITEMKDQRSPLAPAPPDQEWKPRALASKSVISSKATPTTESVEMSSTSDLRWFASRRGTS